MLVLVSTVAKTIQQIEKKKGTKYAYMDKLEHGRFTNMVTKNLLIIVHARKKFGAFLDLDNYGSIKEALMAVIKTESEKALELIRKEYQPMAQKQTEVVEELKKEMDTQHQAYKDKLRDLAEDQKIEKFEMVKTA